MEYKRAKCQVEAKEFCIRNPYTILAMEQGLGKSVTALDVAHETKSKTLVVCPAYLRLNWEDEINKFYPGKRYDVFHGRNDIYEIWDTEIVIISYQLLEEAEFLFEWADMVVFDEAQFMKGIENKSSSLAHRFVFENNIKRCLMLTGTPVKNRVWEFYSLIALAHYNPSLINPEFLNKFETYIQFADHFSFRVEKAIETRFGYKEKISWKGVKNEKELIGYLRNRYFRVLSKDVLDLPKAIDKMIQMEDSTDLRLLEEFEVFSNDPDNNSVKPRFKAEAALRKVPFTIKYVNELLDDGVEQIVVYTDHKESCKAIAKALGVEPITGDMSVKKRHKIKDEFQAGRIKIIVATFLSFSTGVTLIAANNMVFNDYPWVPGDLAQAKFRIIRIGQKNRCIFHWILGSYQDRYILETLQEKTEEIKAVVDFKEG